MILKRLRPKTSTEDVLSFTSLSGENSKLDIRVAREHADPDLGQVFNPNLSNK